MFLEKELLKIIFQNNNMTRIKTKRERVKFASDNVSGACPEVLDAIIKANDGDSTCLLYTSPSPRDGLLSRMPSSA